MKRADGIYLKHTDPMYRVAAHVMAKRSDSLNMITLHVPVAPISAYLGEKRKEGKPLSHMAVIMAAYVRAIATYPALNRFVVNKRIYARKEIAIGMVVLGAEGASDASNEGTMSKVYFKPEDTIFDVQEKIEAYVAKNRTADNSTEELIGKLLSFPGLLRVGVNVLKWADKHNLLPKSIIDASPFHCSLVFTNLASIRTNHIYHHCYDFGTTSVVMAAGNLVDVPRSRRGEIVMERMIPLGVCMDERICSGSYYSRCFKLMQKYFADPRLLETPPEKVMPDPEI